MAFIDRELLPGVIHIEDALGVCFTLLIGSERALLVDAGYGVEDVAAHVRNLTGLPVTLWLTHGHFDHAFGARWFAAPRMHPAEQAVYAAYNGREHIWDALSRLPASGVAQEDADRLAAAMPRPVPVERETLALGGLTARIIPCPGHTPGSVVALVPELRLLLTGDDWNPCTWLFFPEALPARAYRENLRALLALPFDHVICPHRTQLYPRALLEAFAEGLTDAALDAARPVDTGARMGIRTLEAALPGEQVFVFDGDKYADERIH